MSRIVLLLIFVLCIPSAATYNKAVQLSSLPTATNAVETKHWTIPENMLIDEVEMRTFSAISSHGRDDSKRKENTQNEKEEVDEDGEKKLGEGLPSNLSIFMRSIYIFFLFLPVISTSLFAYISTMFRHVVWFGLLTHSMAGGGAAYIKWGQWASTRPDLFPEELCIALSHLHSNAPKHSYSYTKSQIRKEFGDEIETIFDYFDPKPIASGSIAQVYKAVLNGQRVAVKVRHPNVEQQIKMDFTIMKAVAKFIESFPAFSWINLSESLHQFSHTIASQTDLAVEGKHLYLFNKFFKSWKSVGFPTPVVLSNSVLVESWEDGTTVSEYTELYNSNRGNYHDYKEEHGKDKQKYISPELAFFVVSKGVEVYLKMLLTDNLMHSDLHPGNIFLRQKHENGDIIHPRDHFKFHGDSNKITNKIILVDAGMVATLVPSEQENFIGLLQAMGRGRGDEAAENILHFSSRTLEYTTQQKEGFKVDMVKLFDEICRGYHTNVHLGNVLKGILNLVRIHKITIEANYATLVMNALCLDSLALSLMPSYNILDGAKQLLTFHRATKKLLGRGVFKKLIPLARGVKSLSDFWFVRGLNREEAEKRKIMNHA